MKKKAGAKAEMHRAQAKVLQALCSKISQCAGKQHLTLEHKAEIIKLHCPAHGKRGLSAKQVGEKFNVQLWQI